MLNVNLNLISKCVAKCKAKHLENIKIPKEITPTAVASNWFKFEFFMHTGGA